MSTEIQVGIGLFVSLIGVIWKIMRDESLRVEIILSKIQEGLDKKVSHEVLAEARAHMREMIEQRDHQWHERLRDLSLRQDREIDGLKKEMDRMNIGLVEMRRDVADGNIKVLQRLQDLAMQLRPFQKQDQA